MNDSLKSLSRPDTQPTRRKAIPAWIIPAGIALGFALLFLILFRDRILPATDVKVAVVLSTRAGEAAADPQADQPTGQRQRSHDGPMAFQASGWIEPDPLPVKATALVSGVIDDVHVLEGEAVKKDQPLATLIREDFDLELREAKSRLKVSEATYQAHHQVVEAVKIQVMAATARMQAAKAREAEASDRVKRIDKLPTGAMAETDLIAIRTSHQNAIADLRSAEAAVKEAEARVLEHLGRTKVLANEVDVARVKVDKAQLAVSRSVIKSPIAGRVLRLNSAPGQKKMLAMDDPDSATVAILYDPDHLQARVDVPLADAAGLMVGQLARIRCNLLPDRIFTGEVTRITGEADIQRNTLQAKVRINDPNDQLRPEMLCRVEFIEVEQVAASGTTRASELAIWIPESAIDNDTAWVCDPETRRVQQRSIQTSATTRDGYRLIEQGLQPGEWVVLSPSKLRDNQRVNPELVESP